MTAENAEVQKVEIPLIWRQVLLEDGKPFPWHRCPAPNWHEREQLENSHVYKWVLRNDGRSEVYIGEAKNFCERLGQYRCPKSGSTEERVSKAMAECEQHHGTIELWFLEITTNSFQLNGKLIDKHSIGEKNIRLILENLAILEEKQNQTALLNVIEENAFDEKIASIVGDLVRRRGRDAALDMIRGLMKAVPAIQRRVND